MTPPCPALAAGVRFCAARRNRLRKTLASSHLRGETQVSKARPGPPTQNLFIFDRAFLAGFEEPLPQAAVCPEPRTAWDPNSVRFGSHSLPSVSKWALLRELRTSACVDAPIQAMLFLIRHLESG